MRCYALWVCAIAHGGAPLCCATHCGAATAAGGLCYALWLLLPQLVWCCRTLGVLPHALCVLAHTWRSAATAAPLSCSRSLCSLLQPQPYGLWAVRREQERAESKIPNPPLRCAEPGAWPLCSVVVLALTDRARVNRYTDITGIPRIRRAESQGRGACCGVRRLRFASAACHLRIPLALPSFLLLLFPMPLALHHHTT